MQEKVIKPRSGLPILILAIIMDIGIILGIIFGAMVAKMFSELIGGIMIIIAILMLPITILLYYGLKSVKPNEALVLTLFGNYSGSIKEAGFYFVNPFSISVNPAGTTKLGQSGDVKAQSVFKSDENGQNIEVQEKKKKISLKIMTLNNAKQKVNDALGTPVEIGVAVLWRVSDTAKAAFNVDNYMEYISLQADAAVRNIVKIYPYDVAPGIDTTGDGNPDEGSLRGSTETVAARIKDDIQKRVEVAGLEIVEARITYLAYATEIASAMLQRQQASAIIDARAMIVDGAVSIVELALNKLSDNKVVDLDDERKAAMVSNLLVVLCGNKEAQPIVNSGTLY